MVHRVLELLFAHPAPARTITTAHTCFRQAVGEYAIDPGVYSGDWSHALDYHWQAYPLRVTGRAGGHGVTRPALAWNVRA